MPYVASKRNMAQITNVHYWDSAGAAWSGNLVAAATPFALLPNPVLVGDFVLFGIDTSVLNSGPFCSLVFDIGTVQAGCTINGGIFGESSVNRLNRSTFYMIWSIEIGFPGA